MIQEERRTILGITMGDPASIGPDILLRVLATHDGAGPELVPVGSCRVFEDRAKLLGIEIAFRDDASGILLDVAGRTYRMRDPTGWDCCPVAPGVPDPATAAGILACLDVAVRETQADHFDGLVTGPVSKEVIRRGGFPDFSGHTDYLASLTGVRNPVMMLACDRLHVVLATMHLPFATICDHLSQGLLMTTIETTDQWFVTFRGQRPVIAVAALNPHAGEGGTLGTEEESLLTPVILAARERGLDVHGPISPDAVFKQAVEGHYDVVVALYHDQGMIPVKLVAESYPVNVTLGLPILRTSVGHGTAFDKAGSVKADSRGLVAAIAFAHDITRQRRTRR